MKLVPNPCRSICKINEAGVCTGCRRTREEIASWSKLTNEQKQVIVNRISTPVKEDI
jgi:predicted Fe-S protein YdhL (DUF1289 family)